MHNAKIWAGLSYLLVFGALIADHAVNKLEVRLPHKLPIETFPAKIGAWTAGPVLPVDPDTHNYLPTAKIVTRDYADSRGRGVELTLVTATESGDIHNPLACFPSQGWHLTNHRTMMIGAQKVNAMDAASDGHSLTVVYWTTGSYSVRPPQNPILNRIARWRTALVDRGDDDSLLVRVIDPSGAGDHRAATFAADIQPAINALIASGRTQHS